MDKKYGDLKVIANYDLLGDVWKYEYEWTGGKYLAISKVLAEASAEFHGIWASGHKVTIGPYKMEVIGALDHDMILCKRLTPLWWARFKAWLKK